MFDGTQVVETARGQDICPQRGGGVGQRNCEPLSVKVLEVFLKNHCHWDHQNHQNQKIHWEIILSGKIMILQGVRHPISCLRVCYASDPQKGGCTGLRLCLI